MAKYDYMPKSTDFPSFMDQVSFSCTITLYKQLKDRQVSKKQEDRSKRFRITRAKSTSIKTIGEIAKQPQLKHIYQGTRDYMVQWVKNSTWKEEVWHPKIP
jgi:hypothetical protein